MRNLLLFMTLVVLGPSLTLASTVKLTEAMLKDLAQKTSPTIDEIRTAFLSSELRNQQTLETYSPELYGRTAYTETNERPIIPFIPIFTPTKEAEVGIRKRLASGFAVSTSASTRQQSAVALTGKYRNVTTTNLNFTVQMDLWKDLFGRVSKAQLKNTEDEKKRAEIEQSIQKKAFLISLRKTYWALVANSESRKISQELLKTAENQSEETVRRYQNSIAETDEVARYKAQVASRKGTLTDLEYQREMYLRQLRSLLPELTTAPIELDHYDLDETLKTVLACTATIASRPEIPYENTLYDETVSLFRNVLSNNRIINSRYSDPEVSLFGRVQSVGVGSNVRGTTFRGSYGASWDDMTSQNRTGYSVGLNVSVPLGDAKDATQKTKELYDESRLRAVIGKTEANVITVHQEIMTTIRLLNEVIELQKDNTQQLSKRLFYMRKKYQQARVSVNELVQDQDALLSSQLLTVDTKLAVLNTLLDYLSVYTETPCEFNRI